MATLNELIAYNMTNDQIKTKIGADSLSYLSLEGLLKSVEGSENTYCRGCFTGEYPIPVQLEMDKFSFEKNE